MTNQPAIPENASIGRTSLVVGDLAEMVSFYRDVVGLTVQTRSADHATLGDGESPLLELHRDEDAAPRRRTQAGLFHTAFRVPTRAALGAALDRIRDRWQLDGASDHYVSEALYLSDPENNGVEIYVDRPRADWPRSADGSAEIGTVALDITDIAAQSDGSTAVPAGTSVGHMHLEVSDIDTARSFYVDTVGLGVQEEMRSALFLAAGDYHHHLGLNTWNGRSTPAGGRGLAWYEFLVPDEAALASARERLEAADISITELDRGFEISDPDGISIRFHPE
jgi:catechol 2,3-dioxygenase